MFFKGTPRAPLLLVAGLSASALVIVNLASPSVGAQSVSSGSTAATNCPILDVGSPGPGAVVQPGAFVITGIAYDPAAPAGQVGVSRVDFYIGTRDAGGTPIGTAMPGTGPSGDPRAFQLTVNLPKSFLSNDVVAYAYDSLSSGVTSEDIPIFVNGVPTAVINNPEAATFTSNCPASSMTPKPASGSATASAASTPAPAANPTIAADGQTLAMQDPATQAQFQSIWGSNAAAEWAKEHNAGLSAH